MNVKEPRMAADRSRRHRPEELRGRVTGAASVTGLSFERVRSRQAPVANRSANASRSGLFDRKDTVRGTLFDINPGHAVLSVSGNGSMVVGEGIRVRFRPPDLSRLDLFGRIKWIREPDDAGAEPKYGVELPEIEESERKAITSYLKDDRGASAAARRGLPVEIEEKFTVQQAAGRLWIWLNGFLNPADSQQLRLAIDEEIRSLGRNPLLVFLDARQLLACPEESLEEIRRCFANMSTRETFLCIVLIFNPVAMLQMRRIAQLASSRDAFVYFNEAQQATAYWRRMTLGWGVNKLDE